MIALQNVSPYRGWSACAEPKREFVEVAAAVARGIAFSKGQETDKDA